MLERRRFDEPTIESRPIGTLKILNPKTITVKPDDNVTSGYLTVIQSNIAANTASNRRLTAIQPD